MTPTENQGGEPGAQRAAVPAGHNCILRAIRLRATRDPRRIRTPSHAPFPPSPARQAKTSAYDQPQPPSHSQRIRQVVWVCCCWVKAPWRFVLRSNLLARADAWHMCRIAINATQPGRPTHQKSGLTGQGFALVKPSKPNPRCVVVVGNRDCSIEARTVPVGFAKPLCV